MRALEKSAEVVVAKKPGNAGGAKDRRSRTGPMVDSSAGSQLPPETGRGEPSSGPGMEGPRVEPGKPEGRRSSLSGGGNRKERPCTRLERASGDSNRRILKTVRPVVWEGAGAQSPALDPILGDWKSPLHVREMMPAVPGVGPDGDRQSGGARFRVDELSLELCPAQAVQQIHPAAVEGGQEIKRRSDRFPTVRQLGPTLLVVGLDHGPVFRQRQLESNVAVHVTVGQVVDHLPDGPATRTVRGVQSAVRSTERPPAVDRPATPQYRRSRRRPDHGSPLPRVRIFQLDIEDQLSVDSHSITCLASLGSRATGGLVPFASVECGRVPGPRTRGGGIGSERDGRLLPTPRCCR